MDPATTGTGLESWLPLVGNIGAPTLVVIFVLMIATGRLVPRSVLNDRMADKDKVIEKQSETITVVLQNNELLQQGQRTANAIQRATAQVVGATEAAGES